MFSVYILESLRDGSYYIGYSKDPEKRLRKHNSSTKGYTSTKKPWCLVHIEKFDAKSEAIKRERFLKAQRNRHFYQSLIAATSYGGRLE